jgi:hypothetical protein
MSLPAAARRVMLLSIVLYETQGVCYQVASAFTVDLKASN